MKTKHTRLVLSGNDLYAIVAPELVNPDAPDNYKEALEQAIEDGVKFKETNVVRIALYDKHGALEQLKPYPIPDGYEVKVKCQHEGIHNSTCVYYAILDYPVIKPFNNGGQIPAYGNEKQQSIEEAAEEFIKYNPSKYGSFDMNDAMNEGKRKGYIAGAKLQKKIMIGLVAEWYQYYQSCKDGCMNFPEWLKKLENK